MELLSNPIIIEEGESREDLSPGKKQSIAKRANLLYLALTGTVFAALFILFLFLPRPTFSELEKRDLAKFPDFNEYELSDYPMAISNWFSDSQPHRDKFLTMSMSLRNAMKYSFRSDEDAVSFIATDEGMEMGDEDVDIFDDRAETAGRDPQSLIEENAKIGNNGIVVTGNAPNARAMMAYGGGPTSGKNFVTLVNKYAQLFPNVKMYVVIANTSGEFYMPAKVAESRNKSQLATLENVKATLDPSVNYVDVWTTLNNHKAEDIFSRTDHHWAPLGAYYAAKAFAQTAKVPFKTLESYDKHVVHDYVGSMYMYSKDINVKNSPEDFIYYTPKDAQYEAEFINYTVAENFQITHASAPHVSPFFKTYNDGAGGAYCTFMGGDQCNVHIKTNSPTGRKLLIIKDSYGNAVPGYLFYSFSDIYVVDFRYFNRNMKKYIAEKGITDTAFVLGIFKVCSSNFCKAVDAFLTQEDGKLGATKAPAAKATESPKKSAAEDKKPSEDKKAVENVAEPAIKEEPASSEPAPVSE